jgi:propionate CoA-transferase
VGVTNGGLELRAEGRYRKFVERVAHITFSAAHGDPAREVLYVTERAVFRLSDGRLELTEVAPGIDIERDVLGQMDFAPVLADPVRTMDARLFRDEPMGGVRHLVEG